MKFSANNSLPVKLSYLIFSILSTAYVFRYFIVSRGAIISGDLGDTRIVIVLLEHWKSVFAGIETWRSPLFFHPIQGALGNTDAHALFAPIYSILRVFFDPYTSYELTLIFTRFMGFFFMALLLRSSFRLPHWICVLGATLFTIMAPNYVNLVHGQFVVVAYIPLLTFLIFRVFRSPPESVSSWVCGIGAAFLFGTLCLSSFYIGWYSALAMVILSFLLLFWSMFRFGVKTTSRIVLSWSRQRVGLICAVLTALACASIPFYSLYMPTFAEHSGYPLDEIMKLAQTPADIFNAGVDNWLWGALLSTRKFPSMTLKFSFPPFFLVLILVGLFFSGREFLSRRNVLKAETGLALFLGSSGFLLWIMFLRFEGWTPYWLIYNYFPGGYVMREPYVITLFLGALFVPVAMVGLNRLVNLTEATSRTAALCAAAACILLVAEERIRYSPGKLSAVDDARLLSRIAPVPSGCQSFFVYGFVRYGDRELMEYFFVPTTQAMMVAARDHVPTLNGISTVSPKGWKLMPPLGESYRLAVQSWRDLYGLHDVCELNLFNLTWDTHPFDRK